MKQLVRALSEYLDDVGAGSLHIAPVADAGRKLPVYMNQAYNAYRASVFGKNYLLLLNSGGTRPTPTEALKVVEKARDALGRDVALVFESMPSFDRKRFVERGIPFIVPGRHAFLPMALIDFREKAGSRIPNHTVKTETLSAPSQALLLFFLQRPDASGWSLNQWAEALRYSTSTLTRVRRELDGAGFCHARGTGRTVILAFPGDRRGLWETAQPFLISPVRGRSSVVVKSPGDVRLLEAGLTALSQSTMLSEGQEETYAMSSSAYGAAVEEGWLEQVPTAGDNCVIVERWRYAPAPLSPDGVRVDKLSLYLSLRDNADERVQDALQRLVEQMTW